MRVLMNNKKKIKFKHETFVFVQNNIIFFLVPFNNTVCFVTDRDYLHTRYG